MTGIIVPDGGTIGSASDTDAISIASDGKATLSQKPTFSQGIANTGTIDAGTLGSSVVVPASIGSSLVLLNSTTISSAVGSVNFDNTLITTTYNSYKILIEGLSSSSDDFDLNMRVSRNNGTSFVSSKSSHNWVRLDGSGEGWNQDNSDFNIWRDAEGIDAESGGNAVVEIVLSDDPALIDCAMGSWSCVKNQNGGFYGYVNRGVTTSNSSADRVNYLRFSCSGAAGNLDKGTFCLYGFKKS